MSGRDYRDDVIEEFAAREAWLLERVVELEADVRAYRELAQQATNALHDVTSERDRIREQHARLLDEYRNLRAQVMRKSEAA